jgi:hypothetical protein
MHIHFRIHHWVLWWFYVGVVCGVVALVNILSRDLSRTQERVILVIGMMFWLLGGLVAHAYDGVKIEKPRRQSAHTERSNRSMAKENSSPRRPSAP